MKIDLTGQKFNHLKVIRKADNQNGKYTLWICRCDCGNETIAKADELRSGHKKSCGCLKHRLHAPDMTGQRFGRLTVLKRAGTKNRHSLWRCQCDCGKKTDVRSIDLTSGNTKSCGCVKKNYALYQRDLIAKSKRTEFEDKAQKRKTSLEKIM